MAFINWHPDIDNFQQKQLYWDIASDNNLIPRNSLAYIHCYQPQTPPLHLNNTTIATTESSAIADNSTAFAYDVSPKASYSDECLSCCSSLSSTPKMNMLNRQQFDMIPNLYTHQMADPMLFIPTGQEYETPYKGPSHFYSQASKDQFCEPIPIEGNAQALYFHGGMAYNSSFSYYNNTISTYNLPLNPNFIHSNPYFHHQKINMNATANHQNAYEYRSFTRSSSPLIKTENTETNSLLKADKYESDSPDNNSTESTVSAPSVPSVSSSSSFPPIPPSQITPINEKREKLPGYPCKYPNCKKSFSRPYNLKSHMRTHTSERPYACNYPGCGWKFARPHDLKRHQLQHTGQKPHSCKYCHRRFARSDALKRHWKVDATCAKSLKQDQIASEATLSKEISNLCKKSKFLVK